MISERAWTPDFRAFMDDRALPRVVRGPVDFWALGRFASIWWMVAMGFGVLLAEE